MNKTKILVAEDNLATVDVMKEFLEYNNYEVITAKNGRDACDKIENVPGIKIALMDISMPVMNGIDAVRKIRESNVPLIIIMVTAFSDQELMKEAAVAGADDFIMKPVDLLQLKSRLELSEKASFFHQFRTSMEKSFKKSIEYEKETINKLLEDNFSLTNEILNKLYVIADFRDSQTAEHTMRVGWLSGRISEEMGLSPDFCATMQFAAPLHDIGKIGIPDNILLKPGKFTKEEFLIMQKHVDIGANILKDGESNIMKTAYKIAYYHHERHDGSGYPFGLRGDSIPLEAQITSVADSFDAIVSPRPYKVKMKVEEAMRDITENSRNKYNPFVLEALKKCEKDLFGIYGR